MRPSLRLCTRPLLTLLGVAVLAGRIPALAQSPELVTDRPDQTESAATVPAGSYQIETGVLFTRDDSNGVEVEATEILGTLVRVGLSDRAELRIGFDGFVSESAERPVAGARRQSDGLGDASVGAKILLAQERSGRPQLALLGESSVPIGNDAVTSDDWEPSVRLAMSKGLSDRIGLGWNVGVDWAGDDDTAFYTVAAGFAVGEHDGLFLEIFGDEHDYHSLDGGWTRLLAPNAQIDLAIGVGITDEAPDWFLSVGFSIRMPE